MRYSREYLNRLAGTMGFLPDTLEKVLRLERMLTLVGEHPFLGPRLVLKGGTALNLFYQQTPRLSVDLDFNYVGSADRDVLQRERPEIERAVEQLAAGEAYQLQRAPEEHAGRKFYLGYWNAAGTQDRIEVDLNYLFRVPLVPPVWRDGWTPDPDVACRGRIAGAVEVWAGKLLALLDRVAARDLYDAAQLAEMPPADPVAFRRRFIGLSGILPKPLTAYDTRHLRRRGPWHFMQLYIRRRTTGVAVASGADQLDVFEQEGRRAGHATIDQGAGRLDLFDRDSRRTGNGIQRTDGAGLSPSNGSWDLFRPDGSRLGAIRPGVGGLPSRLVLPPRNRSSPDLSLTFATGGCGST